ncbi:RNA polymerase sigma-70 factor, ECF subfamily [Mariniphaga anaerophila]|uniref:RNA polymerase sigma-70 factor, ECF subfamily n=1 Tax=Mariniphaga anaerophila TaxID=1484053 RepID=A0A1M5F9Q6_9BACT|nr:RNA polymerase sigma-70 factor [Mariniphaga anaerophila]SHF88257.1 RNA polymerase sigma-70 factor, ECF subfamily [Mariniphaga anaerophila]
MSELKIEKELVEKLRLGNEMAFELIFHRSKGKLKGFLTKVLPAGEDAESVLQEVYLKVWQNKRSIKTNKSFETYLFAIARNMVIDLMRKRYHQQKYLEELFYHLQKEEPAAEDTPLASVSYSALEKKVFESIEKLPPQRQKIFKLNRIDGLTYKEIAQKLDISENTVDSQMRSSLAFLRKEMKFFLNLLFFMYL